MKKALCQINLGGVKTIFPTPVRQLLVQTFNRLNCEYIQFIRKYRKSKYADYLFLRSFGRKIDWKHPRDLNEKIQYLMFKTDTREWSRLSDKLRVREYVKEKGVKEILVPLYGSWDTPEEIDFNKLPDSFVLKTNHGCACTIVIKEKRKTDISSIKQSLSKSLGQAYGDYGNEPHYNRIRPCIIAERYISNGKHGLIDYKIWCLDGQPYCIFTAIDRNLVNNHAKFACYSLDWQRHDEWLTPPYRNTIPVPRPLHLDRMINYARILAEGFPQVRVDFYEVDGITYFGEMTFTSAGGRMNYFTSEQLIVMGNKVTI